MFNFKQSDLSLADAYEAKRFCQLEGISAPLLGSAITGGSSLLGGLFGSSAASDAAKAQQKALQSALDLQKNMYMINRSDKLPYMDLGRGGIGLLSQQYGLPYGTQYDPLTGKAIEGTTTPGTGVVSDAYLLTPNSQTTMAPWLTGLQPFVNATANIMNQFQPGPNGEQNWMEGFKQSPGYAWARDEALRTGLQSMNTGGAGGGGGRIQALTDRSSGLASQDYQNWVNNYLRGAQTGLSAANQGADELIRGAGLQLTTNEQSGKLYNDYFNRLAALAGIGQTASTQTGNLGQSAANSSSYLDAASGISAASGIRGSADALSRGITGAAAPFANYLQTASFGGPSSGSSNASSYDIGSPGFGNAVSSAFANWNA